MAFINSIEYSIQLSLDIFRYTPRYSLVAPLSPWSKNTRKVELLLKHFLKSTRSDIFESITCLLLQYKVFIIIGSIPSDFKDCVAMW